MDGKKIQKTPRGWCEKLVDVAEDTRCVFASYLQAVRSVVLLRLLIVFAM